MVVKGVDRFPEGVGDTRFTCCGSEQMPAKWLRGRRNSASSRMCCLSQESEVEVVSVVQGHE